MKKKIIFTLIAIAGIIIFPLSVFSAQGPQQAMYDPSYDLLTADADELDKWYSHVVEFSDASLRAAIYDNLGMDGGVVTVFDMLYHLPTTLDISRLDIRSLDGLEYAINLEKLYAGGNLLSLEEDISAIKDLYKLEVLDLSRNDLTSAPEFLFEMDALTSLNLSDNDISEIESFGTKSALTELYMENNKLISLPVMNALSELVTLSISSNELESFPEGLSSLTALTSLAVANNDLTVIPDLSGFTGLSVINLEGNNLTAFPEGIGNLTNLIQLDISENDIKSIPQEVYNLPELSALFISFNGLETIPAELSGMAKLAVLDLSMNKIDVEKNAEVINSIIEKIGSEAFMYELQFADITAEVSSDSESRKPKIVFGGVSDLTLPEGSIKIDEIIIRKSILGGDPSYITITGADLLKGEYVDYEAVNGKIYEYVVTAKISGTYLGSKAFEYESTDTVNTQNLRTGFVFELSTENIFLLVVGSVILILLISVIVKMVRKKKNK